MSLTVLGMVLNRKCPYHCKASLLCLPLGMEGTLEEQHFAAGSVPRCVVPADRGHRSAWPLEKDTSLICLTTDVVWTMCSCSASGDKQNK